jgi:hypothetical protein
MPAVLTLLLAPPQLLLRALDDLHRIADAAESMERSVKPLEDDIDGLREAFEGSNVRLGEIREAFTPQLAALHAELLSLRAQLSGQIAGMEDHLSEVADTVEPLQGAAERVGRAVERLPGPGKKPR